MSDYDKYDDGAEEVDEGRPHFFCKLTFGQFFTLMVLEIITLSFVFYLGARYGNEYLKLDVMAEARREPVSIVSEAKDAAVSPAIAPASSGAEAPGAETEAAELGKMAHDALQGGKADLKQRVAEILAREQGPTAPPVGEPAYEERSAGDAALDAVTPGQNEEASQSAELPPDISRQLASRDGSAVANPPLVPSEGQGVIRVKSSSGAKFSVQVGSYPDVREASYRVEEWKAKGYPAYMVIANLGDKGEWYRVRIGAFADQIEAGRYLEDVKGKEGIIDAIVVKNEQ